MSRVHEIKCWPSFYQSLRDGSKTFEVRRNDRDYTVGDVLLIQEWNPAPNDHGYTGREVRRRITYVLRGGEFGIEVGWCVLGLGDV